MGSLIFLLFFVNILRYFVILSPKYLVPISKHHITITNKPAPTAHGHIIYEFILKQHTAIAENINISFNKYFLSSLIIDPIKVHFRMYDFKKIEKREILNERY